MNYCKIILFQSDYLEINYLKNSIYKLTQTYELKITKRGI